ncbi:MAG: TRAP transporter small permease subunit, partial [Rikenellaceae bacterium]
MIRAKIDKILGGALAVILSAMVVDVVWQVMSRYLFASPSIFTDELAAFLLIWLGILGGAYVYGQGEHLAISFVAEKFSPSMQLRIKAFVEVVVLLFALSVMVVGG